jgi:chaperonin GroES
MQETYDWQPIGDLVLLKEIEAPTKSKGGLILSNASTDYVKAKVTAVGPGLFTHTGDRIPMTVAVGDILMIHKNQSGENKKVKLNDESFLLVHEGDLSLRCLC